MFLLFLGCICLFGALSFGVLKILLKHDSFIVPFAISLYMGCGMLGWWGAAQWPEAAYARALAGLYTTYAAGIAPSIAALALLSVASVINFVHRWAHPRWFWVVLFAVLPAIPTAIWCFAQWPLLP